MINAQSSQDINFPSSHFLDKILPGHFLRCISIIYANFGFYRLTVICYPICRSCHSYYFHTGPHSVRIRVLVFWNQMRGDELLQSVRCGNAGGHGFILSGPIIVSWVLMTWFLYQSQVVFSVECDISSYVILDFLVLFSTRDSKVSSWGEFSRLGTFLHWS